MTIEINNIIFKTKRAADNYIKHILLKYKDGERFINQDVKFILDSIKYREKYGDGIKILSPVSIKKIFKRTSYNKIPTLFIEHSNGNIIEVNYNKFYSKRKLNKFNNTPQMNKFIKACRYEISKQNGNITKNIKHHDSITFRKLVDDFIKSKKININTIKMNNLTKDERHIYFKDKQIAKDWSDYHNKKAKIITIPKFMHSKLHAGRFTKKKV